MKEIRTGNFFNKTIETSSTIKENHSITPRNFTIVVYTYILFRNREENSRRHN